MLSAHAALHSSTFLCSMASQETKAGMEERKTGGAPPTSGESTAEVNMCVCVEGLVSISL